MASHQLIKDIVTSEYNVPVNIIIHSPMIYQVRHALVKYLIKLYNISPHNENIRNFSHF